MTSIVMIVLAAVFAASMLATFAMNRQSPRLATVRHDYEGGFGSGMNGRSPRR